MNRVLAFLGLGVLLFLSMSCERNDPFPDNCPDEFHPSCLSYERNLPFPSNTEVYAVGVYEAREDHCFRYHPQGTVNIDVRVGASPYILVLTSYEPVLWKLNIEKGDSVNTEGNLAGVILSGYHCQEIDDLTSDVPVINRSYDGGSSDYFYAYESSGNDYNELASKVKAMTGEDIKKFQGRYTGTHFVIY